MTTTGRRNPLSHRRPLLRLEFKEPNPLFILRKSRQLNHERNNMNRTIGKWHGGKHYLAQKIVNLLPPHKTYVEPFGGMASVLLNKPPSDVEVYNDIDRGLVNLFCVLRESPDELSRLLSLTPYSEHEYNDSFVHTEDPIEYARRYYTQIRMSIGGRRGGFSYTKHRSRRGMADVVSAHLSAIDEVLPSIVERLRTVQIMCRDWRWMLDTYDSPETTFYLDPPYLSETRSSKNVYEHEMSESDHIQLVSRITNLVGAVAISGYDHPIYNDSLRNWNKHVFDMPNNSSSEKIRSRRKECIWINR